MIFVKLGKIVACRKILRNGSSQSQFGFRATFYIFSESTFTRTHVLKI